MSDDATKKDNIKHVTDADFATEVEGASGFVLVDFWAEWCGPCKMLEPHVEEVATDLDGKLQVAKLNVDENRATAMKYQVMGIPTMILFKGGEVVSQSVGFKPASALKDWLKSSGIEE